LAQACLIIVPLTAGAQGRIIYLTHLDGPADEALSQAVLHTIARLCPDVIEAMRGLLTSAACTSGMTGGIPRNGMGALMA
jgi:hypothetical protein